MKTIFIIEDHPIVLESLVTYFKDSGNWKIKGKAQSIAGTKKEISRLKAAYIINFLKLADRREVCII